MPVKTNKTRRRPFGSCCIYPLENSCTTELDFSCFNVTSSTCNNIKEKLERQYGYGSYGVNFTEGKCCCSTEDCGGSTKAPPKDFIGLNFNQCMTKLNGPNAFECGGPCKDNDCQYRRTGSGYDCVFDCNCSAVSSNNTNDDSAFVQNECCSCNPDCNSSKSKNNFCSTTESNCETSCENCPPIAFVPGGACCCQDASSNGFPSCDDCISCSYTTEMQCREIQNHPNDCENPLGQPGSYPCNCTFYPEQTCDETGVTGCVGYNGTDEEKYTPLIVPVLGTRVPPKMISVSGITPVPVSREQLSGILCSNGDCQVIYDLYEYIMENGTFPPQIDSNGNYQYFLPYVPEIYSELERTILPTNQNGREHFCQMATIGGHGINRKLTPEEMANNHSLVSVDHFKAMWSVYEAEKTITHSDPAGKYDWFPGSSDVDGHCGCSNPYVGDSMQSAAVYFPVTVSPISGGNCINIRVPKHTEHFVARKLGGIVSGESCPIEDRAREYNKFGNNKKIENEIGGEQTRIAKQKMMGPSGLCLLEDGTFVDCDRSYCEEGLGGTFREKKTIPDEYIKHTFGNNGINFRRRDIISSRRQGPPGGWEPDLMAYCVVSNQTYDSCKNCVTQQRKTCTDKCMDLPSKERAACGKYCRCEEAKYLLECWKSNGKPAGKKNKICRKISSNCGSNYPTPPECKAGI